MQIAFGNIKHINYSHVGGIRFLKSAFLPETFTWVLPHWEKEI